MDTPNITLDVEEKNPALDDVDEIEIADNEEENIDNVVEQDNSSDVDYEEMNDDEDDEDEEEKVSEEDEQIKNFVREMTGDDELYDNEDDESDLEEDYLQKLDSSMQTDIVSSHHPELLQHKYEEIEALSKVIKNEENIIIDPFHRTIPFLTKYEKARILGERAKQLNAGGKPFVNVEPSIMDGYLIAEKELYEKKLPFIIKRPITNGGCEYWKVEDLEILY